MTVSIKSNSKKCSIVDLGVMNKHVCKKSVKFDDMRIANLCIHVVNNNSYVVRYDVPSVYNHYYLYILLNFMAFMDIRRYDQIFLFLA